MARWSKLRYLSWCWGFSYAAYAGVISFVVWSAGCFEECDSCMCFSYWHASSYSYTDGSLLYFRTFNAGVCIDSDVLQYVCLDVSGRVQDKLRCVDFHTFAFRTSWDAQWWRPSGSCGTLGKNSGNKANREQILTMSRHLSDILSQTAHEKTIPPWVVLAITRHHETWEVSRWVEISATSIPALPKPFRTLGNCKKQCFATQSFTEKSGRQILIDHTNAFKRSYLGGSDDSTDGDKALRIWKSSAASSKGRTSPRLSDTHMGRNRHKQCVFNENQWEFALDA